MLHLAQLKASTGSMRMSCTSIAPCLGRSIRLSFRYGIVLLYWHVRISATAEQLHSNISSSSLSRWPKRRGLLHFNFLPSKQPSRMFPKLPVMLPPLIPHRDFNQPFCPRVVQVGIGVELQSGQCGGNSICSNHLPIVDCKYVLRSHS